MKEFNEDKPILESKVVPFEQSLNLATELYAQYEPAIRANLQKEVGGIKDRYRDYPNLIRHFLKKVPDEVAEQFMGHGITKASGDIKLGQLAAVLNIMANRAIKGDWGKVRKSEYIDAYDSGPFLILSKKGKNLGLRRVMDDDGYNHGWERNEIGSLVDIGAVVVNAKFYPMIEKLKELFPDMNIIKASELPDYMEEEK